MSRATRTPRARPSRLRRAASVLAAQAALVGLVCAPAHPALAATPTGGTSAFSAIRGADGQGADTQDADSQDTDVQAADGQGTDGQGAGGSAETLSGTGSFRSLRVTVSQTRNLINQDVSVS
jgi:uncharacterized protein YjbI with pentapeptide repeats